MINSPIKSLRLKNKRLLTELDLKNYADTDPPVSADFNFYLMSFYYDVLNFLCTLEFNT